MPTETLKITTSEGHELSGALELPTGLVRGPQCPNPVHLFSRLAGWRSYLQRYRYSLQSLSKAHLFRRQSCPDRHRWRGSG